MIDDVIMLRHGRTSFNLARRMQGQIDVPLDIVGQWQVDQSAYAMARRYYWAKVFAIADEPGLLRHPGPGAAKDSDIEEYRQAPAAQRAMRVLCSDLFRAQQTAHAFADIMGLPVTLDPRLRERSFGEWEGMTREEIRAKDPADYASWKAHTGGELAHGVESRQAVGARGVAAVESLVRASFDDPTPTTLLLVGHGSWIVATITGLMGMDPDGLNSLDAMRNAFWSELTPRYGGGAAGPIHWQLGVYNHGPELADEVDWENGPAELRRPGMALWKPIEVSA
ncbi:histidine phosphatase family protein [Bifidobacterium mongoliense]|uniref:histidine phosphatase family protein n=1 Tax=Bifidobacterium mongoliense TaxID=518643 RepID=UPI002648C0AD|nr:histidine phosphatase family protein [Bifidobacterium mongoliense]MDN5633797.1 histidine phosphatase family protein [Bifidobacterium mongoliense]